MLLLWRLENEETTSTPVNAPVHLDGGNDSSEPQLIPIEGLRDVIAGLLVPDKLHRAVSHNGVPLTAGLQLLSHTDRLDFGGGTYWVASLAELSSETYSADVHGGDVYCFITKARLKEGDEVVFCPGSPGVECGIIYKREAWEMARQATPNFQCPQCGFNPSAGQWKPIVRRRGSLDRLFALAEQYGG